MASGQTGICRNDGLLLLESGWVFGAVSKMSCGAKGQDMRLSGHPRGLTTGGQCFRGSSLKIVLCDSVLS